MDNMRPGQHRARTHGTRWILAILVGALTGTQAIAGDYQLIDLGVDVSPTDINGNGTVVGARKTTGGNIGIVWTATDGLQDIPGTTVANAVNDAGQIAGNTLTGAFLLDGTQREWDGYSAYGINAAGELSGNKQLKNPYRPTPLPLDPVIYRDRKWENMGIATVYSRGTRQGVYADLYVLNDINDAGYAVGSRSRYGLAGSSSILTTPAFDAVTYLSTPYGGSAKAINNANQIVGTTGSNSSTGEYAHAYLYDEATGVLQDLGTLNGGLTSTANDINDAGQVVGSSWLVTQLTSLYDPTLYHAFLWQDGVMSDLNDALEPGSAWLLTSATAINENGDIVGTAIVDGQAHGFLLTTQIAPPPPGDNQPPLAVADADVTSGYAPLTVAFSGSGSSDPDGDMLSYRWDFGDGSAPDPSADPIHTYDTAGSYVAVLTVTDPAGQSASAQVDIRVRRPRKGR